MDALTASMEALMSTCCVSVLVGAHEPVVLCGLVTTLRAEPDFTVVAGCRDGMACLEAIRDLSPELAVLDAALPNQGALQVLTTIRSEQLRTQVIFLSQSPDSVSTADLMSKGAYCVLSRDTSLEILVRCLRDAPDGQKSAPKLLNGHDVSPRGRTESPCDVPDGQKSASKSLNGHDLGPRGCAESPCDVLTERERQIMQLVRAGLSNKDIGRQCNLSDGTVKVHLHHIYEKLAIRNRTALAVLATGDLHASTGSGNTKESSPKAPVSMLESAARLRPKVD